jgi:hypothetical protein
MSKKVRKSFMVVHEKSCTSMSLLAQIKIRGDMIMLTITTHKNGLKMERFHSLNTNPLCNPFCLANRKRKTICKHCYAVQLVKQYRRVYKAYERNGKILSKRFLKFEELPVIEDKYFRFAASGELINNIHYQNLCNIARRNIKTQFVLWTKRLEITSKVMRPRNLKIIFSNSKVDDLRPVLPKGAEKIFSVYSKKFAEENNININCKKKCFQCLLCYKDNNIRFVNELLKSNRKGGKHEKKTDNFKDVRI